jgi:hypothetical protein
MLKVCDHFCHWLAGGKHGVCSPRTTSCVARHLLEDPTRCLEPVVITSICTVDQRGVFVKFLVPFSCYILTGNYK